MYLKTVRCDYSWDVSLFLSNPRWPLVASRTFEYGTHNVLANGIMPTTFHPDLFSSSGEILNSNRQRESQNPFTFFDQPQNI